MKHSEFVDIVNEVMVEQRDIARKKSEEIQKSSQNSAELVARLIAESYVQSTEIAAITTRKIIEKSGLIQFDD